MKFTEHIDNNILTVKRYDATSITINNNKIHSSCYLNQHELFKSWQCQNVSQLNESLLDELISLKPEVIIMGTGVKQVFPNPQIFSYCSKQGIGLEVMANDVACRTYNVLTSEDRKVVLAIMFQS